jgi:hypothetical protein
MKDIGNWAAYVNRGLDSLISIVKKRMGYLRQVLFVDLAFVHAGLRDFTQAWGIDRFWAVSQFEVWGKRTYGNAVSGSRQLNRLPITGDKPTFYEQVTSVKRLFFFPS